MKKRLYFHILYEMIYTVYSLQSHHYGDLGCKIPFFDLMETGTPHAKYAIIENNSGKWLPEYISVNYDWKNAAALAKANGRPDWIIPLETELYKN